MATLCGPDQGKLFDLNETWYTDKPELSLCFRVTLLVWIPCGVVLFLLLYEGLQLLKQKRRQSVILWTKLGIAKIVCLILAVLIVLSRLVKLGFNLFQERNVYWNQVLSCSLVFFCLSGLLCSTLGEHGLGVVSSGPVFISLFVLCLSGLLELYSSLDDVISAKIYGDFSTASFLLYYGAVIVSFILSFFALKAWTSEDTRESCPEQKCSFINRILFGWTGEIIWLGWKQILGIKDLWRTNHEESSVGAYSHLRKYLEPEFRSIIEHKKFRYYSVPAEAECVILSQPKKASLYLVLWRAYKGKLFFSGVFNFINNLLFFLEPFLLKYFIAFASDMEEPLWHGLICVVALFCLKVLRSLCYNQYYYRICKLGMEVRTALTAAVYAKSLKLSASGRKETTVGEIVNLMSVDASRMEDVAPVLHNIWSAPFQIFLAMYLLYANLGSAAFAGAGVFVAIIPLNVLTMHYFEKFQEKQMNEKDKRIKLLTEILNGIKILKLYAWELAFQGKIQSIRTKEIGYLKKTSYINGILEYMFSCCQLLACIATFGTYILMSKDHNLTPATAFVALFLFEKLQMPLGILPMSITYCAMLRVSIRRLQNFFGSQELNEFDIDYEYTGDHAICVNHATFAWNEDRSPSVKDVSLSVPHGSLVAIVGHVGAGKSSFLSALCGEMNKMEGSVLISGNVGLVPQQAWIQNMTVRQNIVFSRDTEDERYWKMLEACALQQDLKLLAHGDLTEIGERGINLSGGQKQRVSLARAVYQDASIYLLDDPLSAVDVHVGKHIFENVIGPKGCLKNKTRILVTHGLCFLSQCDSIVVMKNGEISERGSMKELLEKKGAFADFLNEYLEKATDTEIEELDENDLRQLSSSPNTRAALAKRISQSRHTSVDANAILDELFEQGSPTKESISLFSEPETSVKRRKTDGVISRSPEGREDKEGAKNNELELGRMIDEEEVQVGKIPWSVYFSYLSASGKALYFYLLFLGLAEGCYFGSMIWLQIWSDSNVKMASNETKGLSTETGLGVYASFSVVQGLATAVLAICMVKGQIRASQKLHDNLLANILRAPMAFFDTTPSGRIVNRCGKDMDVIDNQIPSNFDQVAHCFFYLLEESSVIIYATPWFLVPALPIAFIYIILLKFYVQTTRQLRRLESVSRSPLYSHFQETLQGVSVIRAFRQQERFALENQRLVDDNNRAEFAIILANRWLGVRLDFIGILIACFAALLTVLTRGAHLSPGLVGLSLSNAFSILELLSWGVMTVSTLETEIVAMERIGEYTRKETEAPWRKEGEEYSEAGLDSVQNTDRVWLTEGRIDFDNYSLRYRPGLDLVLNDISCSVKPSEKIGVVGRTGAGKSSLTLALFRIVEAAEGRIRIDNRDISDLGLHDLREKLTIIPQDPVLFSGTLRMNLDPFDSYSDQELWSVLGISHLKDFVESSELGLQYEVTEGGSNLSVGQRQLLCLARALLRRSKILVLDEATAAVDLETDALIQETIGKEFRHCTVITIAHRINTILDSDRILVLDSGNIIEFDSPKSLIERDSSHFKGMVLEAGVVF